MRTPDKIYLPNGKEAVQNGLYKTWFDTDEHDMPYAEYIRKDALLEWIEKEIQALSDGSLSGYYISLAYKDMIEHLNEM